MDESCILILHEKAADGEDLIGGGSRFIELFQVPAPSSLVRRDTQAVIRDIYAGLGLGADLIYDIRADVKTSGSGEEEIKVINMILRNAAFGRGTHGGGGELMDSSVIASNPKVERLVEKV